MPQGNYVKQKEDFFKLIMGGKGTEIAFFLCVLQNLFPKITLCFLLNEQIWDTSFEVHHTALCILFCLDLWHILCSLAV